MKTSSKICKLFLLVLCLSMILPNFNKPIIFADTDTMSGPTSGTTDRKADDNTMDDYINRLSLRTDSKYAGRVWSDKTVTTDDIILDWDTDGYDGIIENESDFLHVFSAMGSSQVVKTKESIPLDVVFVLDVSRSMTSYPQGQREEMRMKRTMRAVGNAINALNKHSPYNRVGISLYADTGAVYLPLVNLVRYYDPNKGNVGDTENKYGPQWFCEEVNGTSDFQFIMNGVMRKAIDEETWDEEVNPVLPEAGALGINNLRFTDYAQGQGMNLGNATNMQSGIAAGMDLLAKEEVTTWKSPVSGVTYDRIPIVMVMTDGGCNTLCFSNDAGDTSAAKAWYDTNYKTQRNTLAEDTKRKYIASSVVPTLLTSAYNMARIKKNYKALPHAFGVAVDVPGEPQTTKINAALDPSPATLTAATGSLIFNAADNAADTNAFDLIEQWKNESGSIKVGYLPNSNTVDSEIWISSLNDDVNGITKENVIDNLYFTDSFYDVNSDDMSDIFTDILKDFTDNNEVFSPVGGANDIGVTDKLTYMDPIGKYMEVKSIKNVLLFGQLYDVEKDGDLEYYLKSDEEGVEDQQVEEGDDYTYSIQHYKITEDKLIENPSYGENSGKTFNLSDIEIYIKDTGNYQDDDIGGIESDTNYKQALYINIPAEALPIQVANILMSDNGTVIYNTNIAKKEQSTPFRVFYEVGISDDIKTGNNNIDMTKVDPEYVTANKSGDLVYFYSNWYSDRQHTDYVDGALTSYSSGDPVLSFSPHSENSYYFFQDYVPLLDETNNTIREMNPNSTYHMDTIYYTASGKIETNSSQQKTGAYGSKPGDTDEIALAYGESLCWYNPTTKDVLSYLTDDGTAVRNPSNDYIIATKKGAVAIGDMSKSSVQKTAAANKTQTAGTVYLPTYSSAQSTGTTDAIINVYLGNNGSLAVSNTQLLVTKTVEEFGENTAALNESFEYTIHLSQQEAGEYNAIKATREADGTWRALIETIALKTGNYGRLRNNDNTVATVGYSDGKIDKDGSDYYIYVGGVSSAEGHVYTMFDSKRGDSFHDKLATDSNLYVEAWLVPVSEFDNDNNWVFSEDDQNLIYIEKFLVGSVGFDTNTQIGFAVHMDYNSESSYQTQALYFDNAGNANFKLKDGEGLLFIGLDSGTIYTVTEKLTQEQVEAGISFKRVKHKENDEHNRPKETIYDKNSGTAPKISGTDIPVYEFDYDAHTYTVSGNTTPIMTEEVNYFNAPPRTSKELVTQPENGFFKVGDEVSYVIYWENDLTEPAKITITDPLDKGVDFVSAEFVEKKTVTDGEITTTTYEPIGINNLPEGWKWSYNGTAHTVTWTIPNAAPKQFGFVRLTVKVNDNAAFAFDYENGEALNERDNKIINRAFTTVNDNTFATDIVEAPVNEVQKTEVSVTSPDGEETVVGRARGNLNQDAETGNYVGPLVGEDWDIKYKISFTNYKTETATVTVADRLDPDVDFISAGYGEVTLSLEVAADPSYTIEEGNITITYDPETRTVKWIIADVDPLGGGEVYLTVRVTQNAVNGKDRDATDGGDEPDDGPKVFKNVGTSINEPGTYIMVYNGNAVSNTVTGGSGLQGLTSEPVEISEDTITTSDVAIMWTVDFSGNNQFYLYNESKKAYLMSGSGTIEFYEDKDSASIWSNLNNTTYPGFLTTLTTTGSTVYFGYYTSSNIFRGYASSFYYSYMKGMTFYKLEESGSDEGSGGNQPDNKPMVFTSSGNKINDTGIYLMVYDLTKEAASNTVSNATLVGESVDISVENTITLSSVADADIMWEVVAGTGGFYLKNLGNGQYLRTSSTVMEFYDDDNMTTDATLWQNAKEVDGVLAGTTPKLGVTQYFGYYGTKNSFAGYSGSFYTSSLKGMTFYKYDASLVGDSGEDSGEDPDEDLEWADEGGNYKILNRASVQVDNDSKQITETMENPLTGTLTVGKQILDYKDEYADKEFEFIIKLTMPIGVTFDSAKLIITKAVDTIGDITWKQDQNNSNTYIGSITLKHDEWIKIDQIPYNAGYYVTEEPKSEEFHLEYIEVNGEILRDSSGKTLNEALGDIKVKETNVVGYNAPAGYVPPATPEPTMTPVELPETGGMGTWTFGLFGSLFFIGSVLWFMSKDKKNRRAYL